MKSEKDFLGFPKEITWKGDRFWLCFRSWAGTPYYYRCDGRDAMQIVNRRRRLTWVRTAQWFHERFVRWGELAIAEATIHNAECIAREDK